jgi:hypothetical protein
MTSKLWKRTSETVLRVANLGMNPRVYKLGHLEIRESTRALRPRLEEAPKKGPNSMHADVHAKDEVCSSSLGRQYSAVCQYDGLASMANLVDIVW